MPQGSRVDTISATAFPGRCFLRLIFVTASICLAAISAFGQVTTATFYGNVSDSSGAVVPGASVTFLNEGTASVQKKTTNPSGEFAFDFLRVGAYTIRIV